MKILAKEIVGENAISMQSGRNLYDRFSGTLLNGEDVELDFEGVNLFASPFFNASVGLLLKDIDVKTLQEKLKIVNLSNVGKQLLNHVIANAIKYYDKESKTAEALNNIDKDPENQ